ncbi:hypothetical protein CTheo_4663 [Ceratobasidium theobromae]|uniref:Suppressor of white apricot N-terminal domain-containing protein n=1 Tax=Ceratobasidium theobromae TaxID=1582974 RepID=A0A5N5QJE9_9AGAM|nr:hypothetical protein CTheo_4663 [Ceratobasidium theobromae]
MSGNKRKRSAHRQDGELPLHARPLQIRAYEAELVHDRPNLASQLEEKGGLIRWGDQDIWVDRFDVRLLLESVEDIAASSGAVSSHVPGDPLADVGWDNVPSDSEDTFFLSRQEVIEYQHDKRQRALEKGRQDRLRALAEEDQAARQEPSEAGWGNSDEEATQGNLMRRTAAHLGGSPNPIQLEMRILANHGTDPRFAFLRGRWKRAWARMRTLEQPPAGMGAGIGGLAGYASDSDDSEAPEPDKHDDIQARRRERAREWMQKRREEQRAKGAEVHSG